MSDELYFNNELRKCLNAAGLSDCGENDQWNYWYQRLHKAHDAAVDRVTETQRAENAELRKERDFYFQQVTDNGERAHDAIDALNAENEKLRELVLHMHTCLEHYEPGDTISCEQCPYDNETWGCDYERLMAELGIEVD